LFVLLTLGELWFLKRQGFDILAHLQVTLKQGKTTKFFFEAFGVIAFVVAQPFAFLYLFSRISEVVGAAISEQLRVLFP
jgi:hypothetical protein